MKKIRGCLLVSIQILQSSEAVFKNTHPVAGHSLAPASWFIPIFAGCHIILRREMDTKCPHRDFGQEELYGLAAKRLMDSSVQMDMRQLSLVANAFVKAGNGKSKTEA